MMITFPNQKIYEVVKKINSGAPKVVMDKGLLMAAVQILKPLTAIVWLDVMGNVEKRDFAYSPRYYHQTYGIGMSTARNAFAELEEKGFADKTSSNKYVIYSLTNKEEYKHIYKELHDNGLLVLEGVKNNAK